MDPGLGGAANELRVRFWRGTARQSDDEKLLALQGCSDGVFVAIVGAYGLQAGQEWRSALSTGEGSDGVLACFEKRFGEVLANVPPCLRVVSEISKKGCVMIG